MINENMQDGMYDRLMQFAKNKSNKHSGISNMYVIQKTNLNGEIVDEYYGMNMMTDYGMSRYFVSNNNFPTNIYIGNGTETFNHTTNTLISPVVTSSSTASDTTKAYDYPLYYDKISGLITCVCKYLTAYFDYNITNISDTISITEYGLGTAHNALWTHSWVYDITGAQTYITKEINERLTITVFMCYSYYESLITSGWENNRYTVITSMRRFFNAKMYEDYIYTYKRYDLKASRSKTHTSSGFMDNELTRYTNLSNIILYAGQENESGYIDGFCQYTNGFITLEPQLLETPESFDVIQTPMTYGADFLSYAVGEKTSNMPFTQMDIESLSMFNYKTNMWDNNEQFSHNTDHWYSETPMGIAFAQPLYYTNNNTKMLVYVYQNIRTDDPIIKINSNGISTVYVTDKYWDTSTWVLITNLDDIPTAQQTKRYWITPTNEISLSIERQSGELRVTPPKGANLTYSFDTTTTPPIDTGNNLCDNYEYGWFMIGNTVYITTNNTQFDIGSSTNITAMTYDKWLVVFNSATTYTLVDMSVLSPIPTPQTKTPLFTTGINCFTNCYRTETGTGLICLQSLTTQESNIIDLRNNGFKQVLLDSKMATCIWGTNRVAYIPSSDTTKIRIYDLDLNAYIYEFSLPDGISNVPFMFAHKTYMWITNGSTYTYAIEIATGISTACNLNILINSSLQNVQFTSVDEMVIVYSHTTTNNSNFEKTYCLQINRPTMPLQISDLYDGRYLYDRFTLRLRYINNNTLALVRVCRYAYTYNYTDLQVVDFGKYLHDGTIYSRDETVRGVVCYGIFGEFLIRRINNRLPIEYFLPHRIVGTTKTISTVNTIKSIRGKQWSVTVTNIPEFHGLPPGSVQ
ncbi:MAG: hypothetical protein GX963_15740 [Bacteroidales bacterium]|nr:hypothetical protein [Bacteroidales bacterium]